MASALTLFDLPRHFPKEIRRIIFLAYLEVPKGHFFHPNRKEISGPITALRTTNRALYDEILNVEKYTPSIPQTLELENCFDSAFGLWLGYPKRIMDAGDWTLLRYLVLKIKVVDVSERDANGATLVLRLGMSHATRRNARRLFAVAEHHPYLGMLKQVRYDFEYGDDSQVEFVSYLTDFIDIWPGAVSVWAEAVGNNMHHYLIEIVRGFNFARGNLPNADPSLLFLDRLAAWGGNSKTYKTKEPFWEEDRLRLIPREVYQVRPDLDMEITCPGCFARFKTSRLIGTFPEEVYLTKKLWKDHLKRAQLNKKALGCDDSMPINDDDDRRYDKGAKNEEDAKPVQKTDEEKDASRVEQDTWSWW